MWRWTHVQSILYCADTLIHKNLFRGPKKSCMHSYGVCLARADTFGGKGPDPFSAMLEREMGMPILNLGAQHYGAGFYTEDDAIH